MKEHDSVTVKCPACNTTGSFRKYSRIVVTDDDLREKIKDRSIFTFTCKNCGKGTELDYPVYVLDKTRKEVVWLSRKESHDRVRKAFEKLRDSGLKMRIASTKNELVEKLHIFDTGYDDRIIELMKVFFAVKIKEDYPNADIQEVLFITDNHRDGEIMFIAGGRPFAALKVDRRLYDKFEELYSEKIDENDDFLVNFHWAYRIF